MLSVCSGWRNRNDRRKTDMTDLRCPLLCRPQHDPSLRKTTTSITCSVSVHSEGFWYNYEMICNHSLDLGGVGEDIACLFIERLFRFSSQLGVITAGSQQKLTSHFAFAYTGRLFMDSVIFSNGITQKFNEGRYVCLRNGIINVYIDCFSIITRLLIIITSQKQTVCN